MKKAAILLTVSLLSLTAAVPARSDEGEPRDESQMRKEFRQFVAAGKDADAMHLMCKMKVVGVACGFDPELAYLEDVETLWHRRYDAVFTPPANADAMANRSWKRFTPGSRFNGDGVGSIGSASGGDTVRFVPWENFGMPDRTARPFLVVQYHAKPYAVIDLDRDGQADATFDGAFTVLSPDLDMIADNAPDGERFQWRIGPRGSDLRDRPRIWAYRDACYFNLFVDTDGNGAGNCGGGGRLP